MTGPEIDVKEVREEPRFNRVRLAALPLEVPAASTDDLPESVRRAGWLEVLARGDVLAVEVVRSLLAWNGGEGLPFCKREDLNPSKSALAREWVDRLVPAPHGRTAAFEIALSRDDRPVEYLIDPETDSPAARMKNGTVQTAVPQRLFTQSPLAEVVLEDPIWVRVADGTLHLAPRHNYFGINWGYGGSGPGSLALLLDRLLRDISAPAADGINGAADGLEKFTQVKWPNGSIFTREQLEAARDGQVLPLPADIDDDDEDEDEGRQLPLDQVALAGCLDRERGGPQSLQ
ncbi:hypothetical protein OG439_27720 [Amycolatopsis sp. NBC_01307]|uniref:hypothetical protein n=1 Tax=Amycolatopsis sp. NBC_01307 TaxID=2903561 RepID=UPI002E1618D9|nr:hypothetical protein OG439_27720 [Amycolatopsis sp. NBC_01307]